jgi:hypothetical protein
MDDHGLAGDLGQGLVRQPGCGEAGWNEDEWIGHDAVFRK